MLVPDFPDPRLALPDGLVAVGGRLDVPTLLAAYRKGIFPWAIFREGVGWYSPDPRGVLMFDKLHIPRSLKREQKKNRFTYTIDKSFRRVIEMCAHIKRPEGATWIADEFIEGYTSLHRAGFAHSVEVWAGGELVGGLYGVDAGGAFAGESMFHIYPNASKLALLFIIENLKSRGGEWIDVQMLTPHLEALGAEEIARREFLKMLEVTQRHGLQLFDD